MTLSVSKALECLLIVVTPHVFPQEQMSMVLKTVDHLNQAKAEATDNERCAMKTETGVLGSANEEGANPSSIQKRVIIPRRSKTVPKCLCTKDIGEGSFDQDGGGNKLATMIITSLVKKFRVGIRSSLYIQAFSRMTGERSTSPESR